MDKNLHPSFAWEKLPRNHKELDRHIVVAVAAKVDNAMLLNCI